MIPTVGRKYWAIAEGYIPPYGSSTDPALISHETACILNTTQLEAHVEITIFFSDQDPVGPYLITVPPQRTKHVRFNDLSVPCPIPKGIDFSSLIISDVEIVVQHTRLDSRKAENSIMTTLAFAN